MTKAGDFVGSNRLKHMTDAMAHIERSKDGLERSIHFSKNRDCDKDFKMYFTLIIFKITKTISKRRFILINKIFEKLLRLY